MRTLVVVCDVTYQCNLESAIDSHFPQECSKFLIVQQKNYRSFPQLEVDSPRPKVDLLRPKVSPAEDFSNDLESNKWLT